MKWTDIRELTDALVEAHAGTDPRRIRFTDLHAWVTALPGFTDDPLRSNEKILEAIQMAWIDEVS
jgi:FeS assembly protein IscX